MPSIIEELYRSHIHQDSTEHSQHSPYGEAAQLMHTNLKKLTASLNEEQLERLEKLQDARDELEAIAHYATYRRALTFGVRLMAECLVDTALKP